MLPMLPLLLLSVPPPASASERAGLLAAHHEPYACGAFDHMDHHVRRDDQHHPGYHGLKRPPADPNMCRDCHGFGIVRWRVSKENPLVQVCRKCDGTGRRGQ